MSYKTYTTEALVCGSHASNTSDKSFLLFTREAGMLFASARSVREERSKQRFALQDFSHIRVSLVKGKSGWRIGSVESLGNSFLGAHNRAQRSRINFVFSQLRRYVHGEVTLERVFDDALFLLHACVEEKTKWEAYQDIFLLRLHAQLGYIAVTPQWKPVIDEEVFERAVQFYQPDMHQTLEAAFKNASEVSHL